MMKRLIFRSWLLLLQFEYALRFRDFKAIHEKVRMEPVHVRTVDGDFSIDEVCYAIDLACVFYFKHVFCLQRSAAVTLLLRRYGWEAQMVIGAQMMPFKSHAWVEVHRTIVNDKPYMLDIYQVLNRC